MGISQTKTALIAALKLPNTPVVAFHGPWGAGKTYLWREISKELEESKTPLYISCMAHGSIEALKSATVAALLSRKSGAAKYGEKVFSLAVGLINSKLPEGLQLNASLSDLQAFLPALKDAVAGKTLVVFDDIERATELSIHELLGFISFLVDQLEVQILLILNKEKLGERLEAWEQLREKVISIEIALRVSAEDCVVIGLGAMSGNHFEIFSDRVKRLKITNIRALQHMRRVYDALRAEQCLGHEGLAQVIPSIVLYVALHFGVIDHAPVVEKALGKSVFFGLAGSDKAVSEEEKKAHELLAEYNLGVPDDFEEKVLAPYLRTGHLDSEALASYVAKVDLRRRRLEAESDFNDLLTRYWWDATTSVDELLAVIENLRSRLDLLSAKNATRLAELASQLGKTSLADAILRDWIELNKSWMSTMEMDEHFLDFSDSLAELHPMLQNAFRERYYQLYPPLSLNQAIDYLRRNSSWGRRQSLPVENASPEELEQLIRATKPAALAHVFRFFAGYLRSSSSFQATAVRFMEVCRAILSKEPDSRLAGIIKRALTDMGISHVLESPESNEVGKPTGD
jgi:hypothetical protein